VTRDPQMWGREHRARLWADLWLREPDARLAKLAAVEAAAAYMRLGVPVEQVCARLGITADDLAARGNRLPQTGAAGLRLVQGGDDDQGL
jgi:hypothetical protein